MKRFALGLFFALSLALVPACGGDDDGDATDGAGADAAGGGGGEAFCTEFGTVCGFGAGYASQAACVTAFDGFDAARQGCVDEHLGFAEAAEDDSAEEDMHCGHATGTSPCD